MTANQPTYNDSVRAIFVVLEAHNDHSMTFEASSPAIVAILFADLPASDKFEIAVCADVIVTTVALKAMKSR